MSKCFIYGLFDPRTDELRYIGKATCVEERVQQHLAPSQLTRNSHKANWLRVLAALGLKPDHFILEEVLAEDWQEAEQFWIAYFRGLGANLTNQLPGGDGGPTMKGRKFSPEHRAKIAASNRNHPSYANRIPWTKGRPIHPHAKEALRKANLTRTPWNKGKVKPKPPKMAKPHGIKLTWEQVDEIRGLLSQGFTLTAVAEKFSVSFGLIGLIKNNKVWKIEKHPDYRQAVQP